MNNEQAIKIAIECIKLQKMHVQKFAQLQEMSQAIAVLEGMKAQRKLFTIDEWASGEADAPTCPGCGKPLQAVRPGKWQCPEEMHCSKCGATWHGDGPHECEFDGAGVA